MEECKKVKKKKLRRNYIHQDSEERFNVYIENVDKVNRKIDTDNHRNCALDGDRDEYDCNKCDPPSGLEKLDITSQLSKSDQDLDWSGNNNSGHNNKVKKRKRIYLECENQVQRDDIDNKNDQEEKRQKKQRTAKCSSRDSESNNQDLEKRERHKKKKMKAKILSSASALQMGNEEPELGDHHSERKGKIPEKTDTPSCSKIEICSTDICSDGKKKKIPNHQLYCTDDSEICISKKIRKKLKQTAQSSVPSKILSDFTEAYDVHVNKKEKSNNSTFLKELKLDSEELGSSNINRKTKKQNIFLYNGTEIKVKDTDYLTTKRKGRGESRHSSSTRDACDNHLSRCDKESLFDPDITTVSNVDCDIDTSAVPFTVSPHESKQYENNSKSIIEENHYQLSESEDIISVDDFDYDDGHYKVPFKVKRRYRGQKNSNSVPLNNNFLTTDEDKPRNTNRTDIGLNGVALHDIPMYRMNIETDPHSFSNEECSENSSSRPGTHYIKSFDEMLYTFPPGEGIPPEEIENIPEKKKHWKKFFNRLENNEFTVEEIKEELVSKINYVYGYFKRLEENNLTEKELKEVRPIDFDEPYLPTYKHIQFFENLDIKITWALSPLHESYLGGKKKKHKENSRSDHTGKEESGSQSGKGTFKHSENEMIVRNWIKFQEEYEFYDLRPMVALRTARICNEGGFITFRIFRYLDVPNERRFAVYLSQGLPERSPASVLKRLRHLSTYLKNNTLVRTHTKISGRTLGKLMLMLKMYGNCFPGVELIVGYYTVEQFLSFFYTHIWMQNIELRTGSWTEEESVRLRRGIYNVHKEKSLKVAFENKIQWIKIMPYVRTRNYRNLRQRVERELAENDSSKKIQNRIDTAKIIEIVYNSDADTINAIDWQAIAQNFPHKNAYLLKRLFRAEYYKKIPHKIRLSFEDGLKYLYEKVRPRLSPYIIVPKVHDSHEDHPEAEVEIPVAADTTFRNDHDESSECADGNVDECETWEEYETSDNGSIYEETVNTSVMCKTDAAPKKNTDSAGESQELLNTEARLLESSFHTHCSKAHYISASDSE